MGIPNVSFRIHSQFEPLLRKEPTKELGAHIARMYQLCARVPGALEDMKETLRAFIDTRGKGAIKYEAKELINVVPLVLGF